MKRKLLITLIYTISIVFVTIVFLFCCHDNSPILVLSEICGITSNNLIKNGSFKKNLESWKFDKGITTTNFEDLTFAHVRGPDKGQKRLWQEINVISGNLYRLTFELKGKQSGAFIIYRDNKIGKEQYLWCSGKQNCKKYKWIFRPKFTGDNRLYLSTQSPGDYYFGNVSLTRYNLFLKITYTILGFIILSALLLFILTCNKLFAFLVFLLILFPILRISKETKSEEENRNLAIYKPLINKVKKSYRINTNYGKDFNDWLNDHFWSRNFITKIHRRFLISVDRKIESRLVISGKNGWLFQKLNINRFLNYNYFDEEFIDRTAKSINKLQDFCNKNNYDLYILIIPQPENIYYEYLIGTDIASKTNVYKNIVKKIVDNTNAKIISSFDELMSEKHNSQVYYKVDHHWSPYGAYLSYKLLMGTIQLGYSENLRQLNDNDFRIIEKKESSGSLLKAGNISLFTYRDICGDSAKYLSFEYLHETNVLCKSTEINNNDAKFCKQILNKGGNGKKLFLFGDSYSDNIAKFLARTFSYTTYYMKPGQIKMRFYEKEILNTNPDIIVRIIWARNLEYIQNWYIY